MSVDENPQLSAPGWTTFSLRSVFAAVAAFAIFFWVLSDVLSEDQIVGMSRGQYQMRMEVEKVESKLTGWLNERGLEKVSRGDVLVESSAVPQNHVFYGPLPDHHPVTLTVRFEYYPVTAKVGVSFNLASKQPRKLVFTHDAHREECRRFLKDLVAWCENRPRQ